MVSLMVRGLLVRARGLHAPSPATPCAHLSRLVLFLFLFCCYPLQPVMVDFRYKLDCNGYF